MLVLILLGACRGMQGDAGTVVEGEPTTAPQAEQPPDQPVVELAPPNAPTNLAADHVAVFDVVVSWADQSDNEDGFNIYRRRVDVSSPLKQVGSAGVDATQFHDGDTFCGARYQYIIASFNEAGESPATACWEIQLPPCGAELDVALTSGAQNAYDFIAGAPSAQGDFYMGISNDGRVLFSADQEGMGGLIEVGPADGTPLTRISLPEPLSFVRDGVQVQVGNRYAALARNGRDLILFDLTGLGASTTLHYTIWPDIDMIQQGTCQPYGFLLVGSPCISGDNICDPLCATPDDQTVGRPVDELEGTPGLLDLPDGETAREPAPPFSREVYANCVAEALAPYGGVMPTTPAEIAAAEAAFWACVERESGTPPGAGSATLVGPPGPNVEIAGGPTYTPRDQDCDDDPCIPGDDICNPTCGQEGLPGTPNLPATFAVPTIDNDCRPPDDDQPGRRYHCGRPNPFTPADGWVLVSVQDTDGNGAADRGIFYNNNPSSPDYQSWGVWDLFCGQPGDGGQPTTEVRIEPVWYCTYVGDGTFEWYEVARTYVNGVAVSEEIVSGPYYGPWVPGCPPQPSDGGGTCTAVCVQWVTLGNQRVCAVYEYRDPTGAPCTP